MTIQPHAPITEEHRKLVTRLYSAPSVKHAAQLLADHDAEIAEQGRLETLCGVKREYERDAEGTAPFEIWLERALAAKGSGA